MSATSQTIEMGLPASSEGEVKSPVVIRWGTYFKVIAGIIMGFFLYRLYLQKYAFSVGLDYFEPEFAVYWMRLFYAQIVVATLTLVGDRRLSMAHARTFNGYRHTRSGVIEVF